MSQTIASQTTVCRWLPEDPAIVAAFVSDVVQCSRILHGRHHVTRERFLREGEDLEEGIKRAKIDFDVRRLRPYRRNQKNRKDGEA